MNRQVHPNDYLSILHRFALDLLHLSSLDDICWLIADQVIAGLGFTDCVIYLRDDETNKLLQKAAYGPKTSGGHVINNPISIAVGDGIVGSVAASGELIHIDDTRKDPRYIVDDDVRLSELAVPIMLDQQCIGVIDSEHHEAGFYTAEHREMLTTIASMVGTKIRDALHEEALNKTIDELEQTREELISQRDQLRVAQQTAEVASQAKTRFLATLSHEMRTPMNGIIGMAQVLEDSGLDADQRNYLSMMQESSDEMMNVVEHLLDFAALDSNSVTLQESSFNFREDSLNYLNDIQSRCEERDLYFNRHFDDDLPTSCLADKSRLCQLLDILLDNAIKFTKEGSIDLLVSRPGSETMDGRTLLQFEVRDTGIGISEDTIEELFQPFTQSDMSATRQYQGAGLGLAIASKLVTLMGGKIWCSNRTPQGASFFFTISVGRD